MNDFNMTRFLQEVEEKDSLREEITVKCSECRAKVLVDLNDPNPPACEACGHILELDELYS